MVIDKDRMFTAFRRKKNELVYPDHFSIVINFKGIPLRRMKRRMENKKLLWNTNKPNGWNLYKELTSNNIRLDNIAQETCNDSNIIMNTIAKELENVKFKAFGKVKVKTKQPNKQLQSLLKKKNQIQQTETPTRNKQHAMEVIEHEICEELKKNQVEEMERELEQLHSLKEKKGNAAAIFGLKKRIIGGKNESDEPNVILDPETKIPIMNPSEIII